MPPSPMNPHRNQWQGQDAEGRALAYLLKQGLGLVERNFRCKHGELDLVMAERGALVVVEVRFRRSDRYGSAAETVTAAKRSRIIAATQLYLARRAVDCAVRFDVVAIGADGRPDWIKNAFDSTASP